MPQYEYKCDTCNGTYTLERSITEEEVAPLCVNCHTLMTRLWSSPTIVFNAPGFYSTDSKK